MHPEGVREFGEFALRRRHDDASPHEVEDSHAFPFPALHGRKERVSLLNFSQFYHFGAILQFVKVQWDESESIAAGFHLTPQRTKLP